MVNDVIINKMKKIISSYISLIKDFKKKLCDSSNLDQSLNWDQIRCKVATYSELDDYRYKFHGGGCRIEKEKIICEFDYAPMNEYPIKFDLWKLLEFIKTHDDFNNLIYSKESLLNEINKLIEEKILVKLKIGDFILETYQIKNEHYCEPNLLLE
jgi:hypothetical protein